MIPKELKDWEHGDEILCASSKKVYKFLSYTDYDRMMKFKSIDSGNSVLVHTHAVKTEVTLGFIKNVDLSKRLSNMLFNSSGNNTPAPSAAHKWQPGDNIENCRYPGKIYKFIKLHNGHFIEVSHPSGGTSLMDERFCTNLTDKARQLNAAQQKQMAFEWEDSFGFDLVEEDEDKTPKIDTCRMGMHDRREDPMQLAEKKYEWWYICKVCGAAIEKFQKEQR